MIPNTPFRSVALGIFVLVWVFGCLGVFLVVWLAFVFEKKNK